MPAPDFRQLPRTDQAFLGAGVLVLIASFLPWYGVSYDFKFAGVHSSGSASINAWHSYATLGLLLMLVATALVAVQVFSPSTSLPDLPVSWNFLAAAVAAVGALLVLIRSLDLPSASGPGGNVGLRWGGWLLIVFSIALAVIGAWRLRESGEAMPWTHSAAPHSPTA